jgi:glycosyl transferase family 25
MMFEPINNFFDKIYVITLQRAADRQLMLKQELDGLNYTFMYGMDKNDLCYEDMLQKKVYDPVLAKQHHLVGKEMRVAEIACSISHRMVYEDVVKNKYNKVLILEDDVVVDRNNILLFDEISRELPADWGLWYLGFAKNEKPPANAFFKKLFYHLLFATGIKKRFNHTVIHHLYPTAFSKHLQHAGFHDCAHAYGITLNTAQVFLNMQQPVSYIADHLLAYAASGCAVNAFITEPKLINQQYQVSANPVKSYLNQ